MPYWRLFYHCVWSTRERLPIIVAAIEAPLHKAILAKAKDLGAFPYAVGGTEDHVHLVASVPPSLPLAQFIGQVKGASSHLAGHALHEIGAFAWQAEYGVVSFSGKQLDRIVRYVLNQRQHHAEGSVIPILERSAADTAQPQPPTWRHSSSPQGLVFSARGLHPYVLRGRPTNDDSSSLTHLPNP